MTIAGIGRYTAGAITSIAYAGANRSSMATLPHRARLFAIEDPLASPA